MKRWIWLAAIVLLLLGAVLVWAGWDELFFDEAKVWNSLQGSIGKLKGAPREGFSPDLWMTYEQDGKIVIGYVGFADGGTWQYAFASHHCVPGTESFSLFEGAGETWRLRGSYFCCEIFPTEKQPRNAGEFRAMLKKTGDVVGPEP